LTISNEADRPIAVIVFDAELMPLLDPRPFLTSDEFDERRIEVGASVQSDETWSYVHGNAAAVLLYTRCDAEARTGPAPLVTIQSFSAEELKILDFKVTVAELPERIINFPMCVEEG
jgi:hypothetical protein